MNTVLFQYGRKGIFKKEKLSTSRDIVFHIHVLLVLAHGCLGMAKLINQKN